MTHGARSWHGLMLAALLVSATALPSEEAEPIGMAPLPAERLSRPISLPCGLTIVEWRGGGRHDARMIRNLCARVRTEFVAFARSRGLAVDRTRPFAWDVSLLPYGDCPRCLNDVEGRFFARDTWRFVLGYTSFTHHHLFLLSDVRDPRFKATLAHEMFHALSRTFGTFDSHPGSTHAEKLVCEEALADAFTEQLRLGP